MENKFQATILFTDNANNKVSITFVETNYKELKHITTCLTLSLTNKDGINIQGLSDMRVVDNTGKEILTNKDIAMEIISSIFKNIHSQD